MRESRRCAASKSQQLIRPSTLPYDVHRSLVPSSPARERPVASSGLSVHISRATTQVQPHLPIALSHGQNTRCSWQTTSHAYASNTTMQHATMRCTVSSNPTSNAHLTLGW